MTFSFEPEEIPSDVRTGPKPHLVRIQYVPAHGTRDAEILLFRKNDNVKTAQPFARQYLDADELATFVSKGFAATK